MQEFRACRKRFAPIRRFSSTRVRCMTAICPAGPPNACSEIRNQALTAVPNGTAAVVLVGRPGPGVGQWSP